MPSPDPLEQFQPNDSRYYVVRNISDISEAIVRGKQAGNPWEILVYRVRSIAMGVLGTTGGSGVTIGLTQPDSGAWGYVVAAGSLILAVGLEVYNHLGIESRATQAIKARDAFAEVYVNMSIALKNDAPDDTIVQLSKTVDTLIQTFSKVIVHDQSALVTQDAQNMARDLVVKYSARWRSKAASIGGRSTK